MYTYYIDAIKTQQSRDDYLEMLILWKILLESSKKNWHYRIREPGALQQACWMVKEIYCLKMYMFQDQFVLIITEKKESLK